MRCSLPSSSVETYLSISSNLLAKVEDPQVFNQINAERLCCSLPLFQSVRSVAQSCLTVCDPAGCSTPGFPVRHQLLELAQSWVHRVSDAIQPSHPLSSPFPPAFNQCFPSIRVFSNESILRIRWPKYWSFSISPSNEYSGLISFRMDWLDLLAGQGTLKSLLQHRSSKVSALRGSAV